MIPSVPGQGGTFSAAQLPVAIDYPVALALRQMVIVQNELPKYQLAPEVSALLHYVPDHHRKMLLATLWNTGARIREITDRTVRNRLSEAAEAAASDGITFSVPVTPHTYVTAMRCTCCMPVFR